LLMLLDAFSSAKYTCNLICCLVIDIVPLMSDFSQWFKSGDFVFMQDSAHRAKATHSG